MWRVSGRTRAPGAAPHTHEADSRPFTPPAHNHKQSRSHADNAHTLARSCAIEWRSEGSSGAVWVERHSHSWFAQSRAAHAAPQDERRRLPAGGVQRRAQRKLRRVQQTAKRQESRCRPAGVPVSCCLCALARSERRGRLGAALTLVRSRCAWGWCVRAGCGLVSVCSCLRC